VNPKQRPSQKKSYNSNLNLVEVMSKITNPRIGVPPKASQQKSPSG